MQQADDPVQPAEVAHTLLGLQQPQEKMPTLTMVTPASRINRTSSSQTLSGHCSGL